MQESYLPIQLRDVPPKSELDISVDAFVNSPDLVPEEKYVILKGIEYSVEQAIKKLKSRAIEHFLQAYNGAVKYNVLGTEVQVTAERKDTTRKKYTYSDEVTKIEDKIKAQEMELSLLRDTLKLQQSIEINHGTAKMDIITEMADPVYGIKVTLRK